MKLFYSDVFVLPLPEKHRFPMQKYRLLRERVLETGLVEEYNLRIPEPAADWQLLLAHDAEYVHRVVEGQMTRQEILRMGFPWSPQLVERSRRSSGGTVAACRAALVEGFAGNLAGGTHHAGQSHAEGYCVFNDSIVAARTLQSESAVERVVVLDCDVHQGNGTAEIASGDDSIFTFSIHGAKNFPHRKFPSDLDVPLPDGTQDAEYLAALNDGLNKVFDRFQPELAIYLAGADPYEHDRLGRLKLTFEGMAERDRLVYNFCKTARVPVAVTMAGGYSPDVEQTVGLHYQSLKLGKALCLNPPASNRNQTAASPAGELGSS